MGQNNRLLGRFLLGKVPMNLIHLWTLVRRMVLPTYPTIKPILLLLLTASTRSVLGLKSPMLIIRIIFLVFILPSRFMGIILLHGL